MVIKYPTVTRHDTNEIINAHREWCGKFNISATPTIFVNDHLLPDIYRIEDLKYFIK